MSCSCYLNLIIITFLIEKKRKKREYLEFNKVMLPKKKLILLQMYEKFNTSYSITLLAKIHDLWSNLSYAFP